MATFKVPSWADTFIQATESDVGRLISQQLWPINQARFVGWYRQFGSPEERFFAAALLHRLTLRTKSQFSAAMQALYRGPVSHLIFPNADNLALVQALTGRDDPKLRLVPVLRGSDPPTKSGVLVLRRLQRIFQLNQKWLVWPWQARKMLTDGMIEKVVFVDDFLGSGQQFKDFFDEWEFSSLLKQGNMIYAPVAANTRGLGMLQGLYAKLLIASGEVFDESSNFFHGDAWTSMTRGEASGEAARAWYAEFAKARALIPKKMGCMGVGDLAMTYGFEHATPNNCLPVLWYSTADWIPLLER